MLSDRIGKRIIISSDLTLELDGLVEDRLRWGSFYGTGLNNPLPCPVFREREPSEKAFGHEMTVSWSW